MHRRATPDREAKAIGALEVLDIARLASLRMLAAKAEAEELRRRLAA